MPHTTRSAATAQSDPVPPDLEGMRANTALLLGPDGAPDALPPAGEELASLTEILRGRMELLIPAVEAAAGKLPKSDIPRYCALACVGEARGKLRAAPLSGPGGDVAYARKLARSLNALCDHYQSLSDRETR